MKKSNPLRAARNGTSQAQDIWFRKSEEGYRIFLEYYFAQPMGTVAMDDGSSYSLATNSSPDVSKKRGMSRAAQRKRRKKNKVNPENDTPPDPEENKESADNSQETVDQVPAKPAPDEASTLWKTWEGISCTLKKGRNGNFEAFVATMSRRLPVTLRIRHTAKIEMARELARWSPTFSKLPDRSEVWQASCSKPELPVSMKESLLRHSMGGLLARQELGSMLPVFALETHIKQARHVLDMCASPGSKTLQMWERLVDKRKVLLVANDVHNRRLDAMKEAVERSGVPSPQITYTCQDARDFALRTTSGKLQLYDTVLCDVPCSGDGTCRKDRTILPQWTPNVGHQLHPTQLKILQRGLALLKPGGFLCYSTCSINPIENEAVVAAALKNERYELVDIQIKGIQLRDGLRSGWSVAQFSDDEHGGLKWLDKPEEASDLPVTLWPPSDPIECLAFSKRLLPQDQDSGAFYLALFRCKDK